MENTVNSDVENPDVENIVACEAKFIGALSYFYFFECGRFQEFCPSNAMLILISMLWSQFSRCSPLGLQMPEFGYEMIEHVRSIFTYQY